MSSAGRDGNPNEEDRDPTSAQSWPGRHSGVSGHDNGHDQSFHAPFTAVDVTRPDELLWCAGQDPTS
jgi:hypothetical protein